MSHPWGPDRLGHQILRRDVLKLGALGLSLPAWLSVQSSARAAASSANPPLRRFGQAKSCIVLFCWGGVSHVDTWDPKPDAGTDVRSTFDLIDTATPGLRITEPMPLLAKQTHRMAVVRSVHHNAPSHRSAAYWNLTGHEPPKLNANWERTRKDWPCIGSLVAAGRVTDTTRPRGLLPGAVCLPCTMYDGGAANGQDGGFLGLGYDPIIARPPHGTPYEGKSPVAGSIDLALPEGIGRDRFAARRDLLGGLDDAHVGIDAETAAVTRSRQLALDMLLNPGVRDAFNLDRETPQTHAAYGGHICGQSALLARRLTEAGVPLVTVYCGAGDLNGSLGDNWDTHGDNFNRLKNRLLPPLDRAGSALLSDLAQRGTLDETLVVFLTEFGRTPKIGGGSGRDHYPNCYSVAFAGGGVQGGQVYGKSDAIGSAPADAACSPADLHATIFHALGIAPSTAIRDLTGRPVQLCDGKPLPLF
jgi:hypothetical protein